MDHRIIHNIYKIQFNQTVKLPNRGKEQNWKMMSYSLEEKKKQVFVGMFVYNLQQPDKRIHLGESPYAMSGESNDE